MADCDQSIWGVNVQNLIYQLRFARFASDPLRGAKSGLTVGMKSSIALSDVVDGDRKLNLKSGKNLLSPSSLLHCSPRLREHFGG